MEVPLCKVLTGRTNRWGTPRMFRLHFGGHSSNHSDKKAESVDTERERENPMKILCFLYETQHPRIRSLKWLATGQARLIRRERKGKKERELAIFWRISHTRPRVNLFVNERLLLHFFLPRQHTLQIPKIPYFCRSLFKNVSKTFKIKCSL